MTLRVYRMGMNEIKKFHRDGYFILKQFLSSNDIAYFSEAVDRIYRQWLQENRSDDIGHRVNIFSLTNEKYFQNKSEERIRFFERILPEKLTKTIESVFGEDIYFNNTQLLFNPTSDTKQPYWHRDMQYSLIDDDTQAREQARIIRLHARIPLIKEKGIELIPGTHKRWDTEIEKNVRFERNGYSNSDNLPGAVLIGLQPGDILIFSAQMLHRGHYRSNKKRKTFDLCLCKSHPLTGNYLDAGNLPGAHEIDKIRNNTWYKRAREIAANQQLRQSA